MNVSVESQIYFYFFLFKKINNYMRLYYLSMCTNVFNKKSMKRHVGMGQNDNYTNNNNNRISFK
jgi:hypothetical protein